MLVVYGTLWYFDLLAMEGARFNKWRLGMRQHDETVWARLKHLVGRALFKGLCGERVIRHDQDDTDIPLQVKADSHESKTGLSTDRGVTSSTPEIIAKTHAAAGDHTEVTVS